jgi:hypothetical protein
MLGLISSLTFDCSFGVASQFQNDEEIKTRSPILLLGLRAPEQTRNARSDGFFRLARSLPK